LSRLGGPIQSGLTMVTETLTKNKATIIAITSLIFRFLFIQGFIFAYFLFYFFPITF
jgi:Sec-independent protein secretion pathway component TatC